MLLTKKREKVDDYYYYYNRTKKITHSRQQSNYSLIMYTLSHNKSMITVTDCGVSTIVTSLRDKLQVKSS